MPAPSRRQLVTDARDAGRDRRAPTDVRCAPGPRQPAYAGHRHPDRRLTAEQVVRYLDGTRHVAFATVTPTGQPRVSPLDTLFLHGRFTLSTDVKATQIAHLRANPACSAVYMEADRIAVVANGTVEWITRAHIDHDEIHAAWSAQYESDPYTWGDVILFRIAPVSMWAYAFHLDEFGTGK